MLARYTTALIVLPSVAFAQVAFAQLEALTDMDRRWALQIAALAITDYDAKARYVWENPYSGNRGEIFLFQKEGECTPYESTVKIGNAEPLRDLFVACHSPDGWIIHDGTGYEWHLLVNSPAPEGYPCSPWSITFVEGDLTTDGEVCHMTDRDGKTIWFTGDAVE